ncbi:MAG TPA: IMP cyclohydrolase [Spirochaetia bacterium]|nr:IMP cyclohydrolase [Spirochaetia bacterium]
MSERKLSEIYRTLNRDHFPANMEISFYDEPDQRQTLHFEKVEWVIDGERKGLRYGENPDQEAALYRLVGGNLSLGDVRSIQPGRYLASDAQLLQSGKHPGKINITDTDSALNILRYFHDRPCSVIIKHNNPCGVAVGSTPIESYRKAWLADRIAAFGGVIALNREIDLETAELIAESYSEVVVAPSYAAGVLDLFAKKKNLRVMEIRGMARLEEFVGERVLEAKSLIDGGIAVQWSFVPKARKPDDLLPATTTSKGREYRIDRMPTSQEYDDLLFGWLVESGVTSNSVVYVKEGVTVGIGTGEQDRVGVAEIARDKAYRKLADRLAWERFQTPYAELSSGLEREKIDDEVKEARGGLKGSVMISDAYFPFRDGIDVGIREGITAILQPGGSIRDYECIEACNEAHVAMVFTGQRSFRH